MPVHTVKRVGGRILYTPGGEVVRLPKSPSLEGKGKM